MSGDNDSSSKTEQPTDKKRRDARERGQVAQTRELTSLVGITSVCIIFTFMFKTYAGYYRDIYLIVIGQISHGSLSLERLIASLMQILNIAIYIIAPVIVGAALISGVYKIVELNGIVFAKEFFKLDFNRLNVVNNFKSTFSRSNFFRFCMQFAVVIIMGILALFIVKSSLAQILLSINYGLTSMVLFLLWVIFKILITLLAVYLVLAVVQSIIAHRELTRKLMMTKDEVKKEYKETNGNPEIKQERRRLSQELLEEDTLGHTIENSTMVLANPTHIAILILYQPSKWPLPIILLKMSGEHAKMIFRLAKGYQIPIVRDKWLARQLYQLAEAGKFIPESLAPFLVDIIGKNLHLMPNLVEELGELSRLANPGSAVTKI